MKAQRRTTSHPRAGAMAQTRQPSGSSAPPHPPPHVRSQLAHDPRRHGGVDGLRSRVPPLRLQAGAARVTHHNESLVTWDLCKMTATRPVTTPNLHFAPPCAKPADHHDTPHKDGRLFNAAQKKNHAAPPNDTSRTRIHRHNASDVRGQGGVCSDQTPQTPVFKSRCEYLETVRSDDGGVVVFRFRHGQGFLNHIGSVARRP